MTFIKQFESIKKKLSAIDSSTLPTDMAIQVNMTDEDCGGTFYIANIGGNFAVEPYDYRDHTVNVTANSKDFIKILTGKLDAADALFRGLLYIEGNIEHATALSEALKAAEKKAAKKPAAKKPAAKKTTTKKATEKKTAAKKTTTKKAAEKKPAAKKTTTKKAAAKK